MQSSSCSLVFLQLQVPRRISDVSEGTASGCAGPKGSSHRGTGLAVPPSGGLGRPKECSQLNFGRVVNSELRIEVEARKTRD